MPRRGATDSRPQPVYDWKLRKCLMCMDKFKSKWIGNRICDRCKDSEVWLAERETRQRHLEKRA